jgi:hypothetical protein
VTLQSLLQVDIDIRIQTSLLLTVAVLSHRYYDSSIEGKATCRLHRKPQKKCVESRGHFLVPGHLSDSSGTGFSVCHSML